MTITYHEAVQFTTAILGQVEAETFGFELGKVRVQAHPFGRITLEKMQFRNDDPLPVARLDLEICEPNANPWWTCRYLAADEWAGGERNLFENGSTHYLLIFDRNRRSAHQISLARYLDQARSGLSLRTDVFIPHHDQSEVGPIVDWLVQHDYCKATGQGLRLGDSTQLREMLMNLLRLGLLKQHRRGARGHIIGNLIKDLPPFVSVAPGSADLYPRPDLAAISAAVPEEFKDLEEPDDEHSASSLPPLAVVTGLRKKQPPAPRQVRQRRTGHVSKVDFAALGEHQRSLGKAGELAVLKCEQDRLRRARRPDLADRVEHTSELSGDGAGYDIRSYTASGTEIYIEVKTTTTGPDAPFYLTRTEVEFGKRHPKVYHIYRVYHFDPQTGEERSPHDQGQPRGQLSPGARCLLGDENAKHPCLKVPCPSNLAKWPDRQGAQPEVLAELLRHHCPDVRAMCPCTAPLSTWALSGSTWPII